MRGGKKTKTTKVSEKKVDPQVKHGFMFDEEDPKVGDTTRNTSGLKNNVIEFCTDKPYRLALYVHPSTRRRVDIFDSKIFANLAQMRQNQDKGNSKKTKKIKSKAEKENVVTLFEDNDVTESQKKGRKLDDSTPVDGEKPDKIPKKGILSFVNINETATKRVENEDYQSSLAKTKDKQVCKSYVKKSKENTYLENIIDPATEEEVDEDNERETKKHTKSKVKKEEKKDTKDEEEYEKWARSMNSSFEEIDKFELSITYD